MGEAVRNPALLGLYKSSSFYTQWVAFDMYLLPARAPSNPPIFHGFLTQAIASRTRVGGCRGVVAGAYSAWNPELTNRRLVTAQVVSACVVWSPLNSPPSPHLQVPTRGRSEEKLDVEVIQIKSEHLLRGNVPRSLCLYSPPKPIGLLFCEI